MSRSRAVRGIAALVALSCVTLAACSSGSSPKPPSRATLQSVVLKQSDVPSGFTGKPDTDTSSGDADLIQQLQSCVGVSGIKHSDQLRQVNSDDFTKGNFEISSDATAFKSQSAVDKRLDVLKSPKINGCLNTTFSKELSRSLPSGTSSSNTDIKVKQGSDGGPSSIVATASGSLKLSASGQSAPAYIAVAFMRKNLLTASVTYFSLGTKIDDAVRQKLDTAVANRVSNS